MYNKCKDVNKTVKKNRKLLLEESRRMEVAQTKNPQIVGRERIFSGKKNEFHVYQGSSL